MRTFSSVYSTVQTQILDEWSLCGLAVQDWCRFQFHDGDETLHTCVWDLLHNRCTDCTTTEWETTGWTITMCTVLIFWIL